jgi:hypothetical protein
MTARTSCSCELEEQVHLRISELVVPPLDWLRERSLSSADDSLSMKEIHVESSSKKMKGYAALEVS